MPTEGGEIVEMPLDAEASAPRRARAVLRDALKTWELDGLGEITELLASELVSNAVDHAGGAITLRVIARADRSVVRLEVDDLSPALPTVAHPDQRSTTGRGMLIIDTLATDWGVVPHPDGGKTVWCEIDTTTTARDIHDPR
jgi:anti-sigma regulatory factor (Ser/Thr protein kinase)